MKKFTLAALLLASATIMSAQTKSLRISTYNGTDIEKYDGQEMNVSLDRYVFTGWNTVCFPFSLTQEQLNTYFGNDCKLESLNGVSSESNTLYLNFQDAKAGGIQANVPYILYYTGESKSISIKADETKVIYDATPEEVFSLNDINIKFAGTQSLLQSEGLYGILAADNSESNFVKIDADKSGFLATRCYISVEGVENVNIVALHNEATGIKFTRSANEANTIYTINGIQQEKTQKGVNIINGKKVLVK